MSLHPSTSGGGALEVVGQLGLHGEHIPLGLTEGTFWTILWCQRFQNVHVRNRPLRVARVCP